MLSVKGQVESGGLNHVPSKYLYHTNLGERISSDAEVIPTIDFSILTSGTPDQRSKVIQDIGNACAEWGFFMVINHGVPNLLREETIRLAETFFNLSEEEKREYTGTQLFDPIRYGTSFNVTVDKIRFWRDFLKIHVHPSFSAPNKPPGLSEILQEYSKSVREVAEELFKGISISLGLEENYIKDKMDTESGSQLLVTNLYPPCPQPELAMGLPPHSDHGLLTILMQNEHSGLQVKHSGKWVPIDPLPNSFLVNTGDHMEILTNGKYKSVLHRAVVNGKATRISVGTAHGPPLETIVSPAPELASGGNNPPAFRGIKYREYLELQQSKQLDGKTCLDHLRI
ncbi:hypothetical protein Tsubulata_001599 [Turnera subulata]|uniref:Fe2OG dioxygenase domain-containing protein n=1 Tax=Turnera subulata TaxID=218843 RepID=A0A9Q0EYE7_9ROSI|nr:hypothetical protein Tsubulata_001599 [Turnera subulata]